MSEENASAESGPTSVLGPAGLIAGNLSLVTAVMIYMGWAYDSSFYGYFHLGPVELGTSSEDYLLSSLSLFKPVIVVAVVIAIGAITLWSRGAHLVSGAEKLIRWIARIVRTSPRFRWLDKWLRRLSQMIPHGIKGRMPGVKCWWKPKAIQVGLGVVMTVIAMVLYAAAGHLAVSTYLVLALIAVGPLLLTSAFRADRRGRVPPRWRSSWALSAGYGLPPSTRAVSATVPRKLSPPTFPARPRRRSTASSHSPCPGLRSPSGSFRPGLCTITAMRDCGSFS